MRARKRRKKRALSNQHSKSNNEQADNCIPFVALRFVPHHDRVLNAFKHQASGFMDRTFNEVNFNFGEEMVGYVAAAAAFIH